MKIKKLQIQSFEGFEDQFEYEFTEPLNALCLKNGAGKTSFLNALRYAITGVKPTVNCINNESSSMAVGLTFHDGTGIIRQDFTDKSARYFLNRRPVSKKNIDDMLQSKAGVAQQTMKIATSTDVLAGLKPQEFGELLLSYIPESLNTEKLINMLGNLSETEIKLMEDFFPEGDFGIDMIDAFYKHVSELRKNIKKKIGECEAYLNYFKGAPATAKSEEELQKELNELNKKQGDINLYKEKRKGYDNAIQKKKELEKNILDLQANINNIKTADVDDSLIEDTKKKLADERERLSQINKTISTVEQLTKTLAKALEDISKPVCPLSEKLKCTTDKSVIKNEIETSLKSGQDSLKANRDSAVNISADIKTLEQKISEMSKAKFDIEKKKMYEEQLKQRKSELDSLVIPEEPKAADSTDYTQQINALVNAIAVAKNQENIVKTRDYLEKARVLESYYNNLVKLYAPKGEVKEKIAEYYLSAFEDQCNLKAKELLPDMSLKFVSDAGISVLTDINGNGNYVGFDSLSGGERSYVLFILLDMINSLTGLRMMFLDELSVLDKDAFETLVKLLSENVEDYDLIILATAEHDDNMDTLKKYKVNMIEF